MRAFVELNLKIAKLSNHKSDQFFKKVKVLAINPDLLQMKPDRPPAVAGFIDRNLPNQACLKHHISIGNVTVFDPLKMRPLWKETHKLCAGSWSPKQTAHFLRSSMCVN